MQLKMVFLKIFLQNIQLLSIVLNLAIEQCNQAQDTLRILIVDYGEL
jgi:hypothetical protein